MAEDQTPLFAFEDLPKPAWALAETLADALDIEMLDSDLYRGVNSADQMNPYTLYGGQVAAQALRAASLTVPEDRYPHSLHGYFLRPGRPDHPVILHVDRDRDGKSFSARHVKAVQNGEVIFSMLASFHVDSESGTYEIELPPDLPAPETLKARGRPRGLVETRPLMAPRWNGEKFFQSDKLWVKATHPLPEDRSVQACALVYLSDLGTGFGQLDTPGVGTGGPSIDHSVWFHAPVPADEWVFMNQWPFKAGGNRGVYLGSMHGRDGRLAAVISQEMLFRQMRFSPEDIERWMRLQEVEIDTPGDATS
jgi:acyl-CoA thioesterase-2